MKKFISEKFHIIFLMATLVFIIFSLISANIGINHMLKNPKYTIGEAITDWHQKNNNGVGTDYKYHFNYKIYFKTTSNSYKKGDKFLIIFDSIKPENTEVLDIYSIENYLIDLKIPEKGWKYEDVPFNIDSNIIKKYVQDWNVEPFEYIQK
ncbi:hypothetical protein EG359_07875 [Chryseobacterium joostei]|uniref:DUF3592 domain-containing protein n=1 Tax=Chryseobacterium joostei TaxID=112234 RepID=A0A1N7I1Z0_9FLAO|nr:hypothetical protein [Chryseobacterium joostei]AZA99531.1 hypothetical protein EG359_07875 [Chryseobacterium joostei]SIS31093.1 hypothetical protein SAMN05421768_102221 [Chryseobacterium joostei]SIS47988.1 hypothetical protein SAMN05421768_108220 [Chryseobacterium joostei]